MGKKAIDITNNAPKLTYKITAKCKNERQKEFLNMLKDEKNQICFGIGSAGSGKSYVSLIYALQALKTDSNKYKQIIIIVPTVEAGAMNIGFLKGTLDEKIAPYLEADSYTMEKILASSGNENPVYIVNDMIKTGRIRYELVNFARGKTFDNCILMINEAENYSKEEMLLLLTRIGDNCKIICTGDVKQLDRKDIKKSKTDCGLVYAYEKLKDFDEVSGVTFGNEDIVRNPLISKILETY